MDASRACYLAGSLPFLFLGTAHALATPLRLSDRKGLTPTDRGLPEAMAASSVLLTRRTDMWRCWVGFNLSHSLGAVLLGLLVIVTGRSAAVFELEAGTMLPLVLLVTAAYLVIGMRYWFRVPNTGIALSLACFGLAAGLRALGY